MKKCTAIVCFALMAFAPSQASADTINLTVGMGGIAGDHILGEIFTRKDFDQSGGQVAVDVLAINGLLDVALGARFGADPEYYRSTTDFGPLGDASATGAAAFGADTSFVLTQVFAYLIVGYDGKNGGSQAYYIGDLKIGDTINIVPMAYPDGVAKNSACGGATEPDCGHLKGGDYYAVTHSTFLNPVQQRVPDSGMTMSLFGMAMAGMGLVARRARK